MIWMILSCYFTVAFWIEPLRVNKWEKRFRLTKNCKGIVRMVEMNRESFISSLVSTSAFTHLGIPSHSHSIDEEMTQWTGTHLQSMSMDTAASFIKEKYQLETTLNMARWPDPILRQPSTKINSTWFGTKELYTIAYALRKTALVNHAVGLAAQQCAIDASLIYIHVPYTTYGLFMVNPTIISRSSELDMKVWDEKCLVLPPSFHAVLLRDAQITVEYKNLDGDTQRSTFRDELSRTVQHEMDHDRGILILDHISLDEMESDEMRFIENQGHYKRMTLAYSRSF